MHVTYVREETQRIRCGWYRGSSDCPSRNTKKYSGAFLLPCTSKNNPEYEVDKSKTYFRRIVTWNL